MKTCIGDQRACEQIKSIVVVPHETMKIVEHFETSGNWLFRWRSYLPFPGLGLSLAMMRNFEYPAGSHFLDLLWEGAALAVALSGLGIRVAVVGCAPRRTSGRNTRQHVAESLNTTGIYSVVRHPLYLGNSLMWLGAAVFPRSFALAMIILLICGCITNSSSTRKKHSLSAHSGMSSARGQRPHQPSFHVFPPGLEPLCLSPGAML